MKTDIVDVIEAAYSMDGTPTDWLGGVASTVTARLGQGLGLVAVRYHLSPEYRVVLDEHVTLDIPTEAASAWLSMLPAFPPEYVRETFAAYSCARAVRPGPAEIRERARVLIKLHFNAIGWRDIFIINGLDPTGHGVGLGVPHRREILLPGRMRAMWSRVAVHLAAANRL